jgi:hypothetical protein
MSSGGKIEVSTRLSCSKCRRTGKAMYEENESPPTIHGFMVRMIGS